jgi:polyhydroxyalkanoate synthesis regulator phasin
MPMTNEELINKIADMLEQQNAQINIMIENQVSKRIDSLFDGYMLTHEKQRELELVVNSLEERVEKLENMAG